MSGFVERLMFSIEFVGVEGDVEARDGKGGLIFIESWTSLNLSI